MRRTLPVVLALSVALIGCRAKELAEKADIAKDLKNRGTIDLMKQVADDKYDPPADGKLTDAQVQMYLKVRDHEKQIAQVARQEAQQHADAAKKAGEKSIAGLMEGFKTMSSAAQMMTADIRAAKDLGFNTQEYIWVKGQILAASTAIAAEQLSQSMSTQMEASYQQMKKAMDESKDEATKKVYADQIANFDKMKAESAQSKQAEEPSLAHNKQVYAKYENALTALTSEMSKWEDKPGEAQKAMDQYQKDLAAKKQ